MERVVLRCDASSLAGVLDLLRAGVPYRIVIDSSAGEPSEESILAFEDECRRIGCDVEIEIDTQANATDHDPLPSASSEEPSESAVDEADFALLDDIVMTGTWPVDRDQLRLECRAALVAAGQR